MLDLEMLFGLDDYETMWLSSIGQDPDRERLVPKVRVCFKKRDDNGEVVIRDNAEILADYATRTADDRRLWRRFLMGQDV